MTLSKLQHPSHCYNPDPLSYFNLHDIMFHEAVGNVYGDNTNPNNSVRITYGGSLGGDVTIAMEWGYIWSKAYDIVIEIKIISSTQFEWWVFWENWENHWAAFVYKTVEQCRLICYGQLEHGITDI